MFPFLNYEFRIRMNAKYKKWGGLADANISGKYGKIWENDD